MPDEEQYRKVKCPHCGWVRRVPARVLEGEAPVALGLKEVVEKIRGLLADRELDEANAWIDMPACPHCKNTYQYNVRSGERR